MRMIVGSALLLAVGVSSGCGLSGASSEAETAEAAAEIEATNAALDAAYRVGDADSVTAFFTEGAVLSSPGSVDLIGRQAIGMVLDLYFGRVTIEKYTLTTLELDVYGAVAYEFGTYEWNSVVAEGDSIAEVGRYRAVRVKGDDGVWRIHRLLDNKMPQTTH